MIPVGIRVAVIFQHFPGNVFPFFLRHDLAGDQLHFGIGTGEVQELAAKGNRRAGRTGVYFFCPCLEQELRCFPQLGAPDDRIVDQNDTLIVNQFMNRDQFHFGNQVPLALDSWHKGTGPGRRIFNKGTGERNAAFVGIPHRMGDTGIRNPGYDVRVTFRYVIALGHVSTAVIPHLFHGNAFVKRRRITVIHPQESADPHLLAGFCQHLHPFRSHDIDFPGA